jgi:ABC-type antimicrobial peptide transport system permease subunit
LHGLGNYAPQVYPYEQLPDKVLTPAEQWRRDLDRLPGVIAGLAVVVLLGTFLLGRRAELAIYQATGATRGDMAYLLLIEHVYVVFSGACVAVAVSIAYAVSADQAIPAESLFRPAIGNVLAASFAGLASAPLYGALLRARRVNEWLRDR